MLKLKIKKGDQVEIIAGDDKGKTGEVIQVMPKKESVLVQGCKVSKKAVKPTDQNPKGGFESREMPIHISNVKKVEG
jgi:large subunit ribosomal protein L24